MVSYLLDADRPMHLFATQNIECVGLTDAKNDEQTLHTCLLHETKQKIGLTGKEKELKFLKNTHEHYN